MNEFLEQFVSETRELVAQAQGELQAIAGAPTEPPLLETLFRSFHTLKGSAGIVEFAPMVELMHAAETHLAAARASTEPLPAELIDGLVECLDLVATWLDRIEATGDLPPDAGQAVAAVRLAITKEASSADRNSVQQGIPDWFNEVFWSAPELLKARCAFRYTPDPNCFFRDEDPLAALRDLPGLTALRILPQGEWPSLDALDPFACAFVLHGLSTAEAETILEHLGSGSGAVRIYVLSARQAKPALATGDGGLSKAILAAQLTVLAGPADDGIAGRIASAAKVAGNVLRALGDNAGAAEVDALAGGEARPLAAKLEALIAQPAPIREISPARAPQSLRVDIQRIDRLVRLAGELSVARNAFGPVIKLMEIGSDPTRLTAELKSRQATLDRLIDELQPSVLALRVVPLSHMFQRFPRMVREIAAGLGKTVALTVEGGDTEADRTIVENLFEPLLHVVRNAVDHGVEPAEVRLRAGKPVAATLLMRAFRLGPDVVVEVRDDGRGIDLAAVKQTAFERGLFTRERVAAMSDAEATEIIFLSGFSTASAVTDLSGRGVGMDAVRGAVGRMRGTVTVETHAGAGTTVRFNLPFSVMMTRVMTVETGGQVFGLAFDVIEEMLQVPRTAIVPVGAAHAVVHRGRTLPVVDLAQVLGRERTSETDQARVVVVRVGDSLGAIEVDRFGERMDLMLTPPAGLLSGIPGIAGTTLLADGRVLIVVALEEILQ